MRDDLYHAHILADMQATAGDRKAREWASKLGLLQALADLDRQHQEGRAAAMLRQGIDPATVRERLKEAFELSESTAKRRVRAARKALGHGDAHDDPSGTHAAGIVINTMGNRT